MERGATGRLKTISTVGGETCQAFIPFPLPPNPWLQIDPDLHEKLDNTLLALGRLDTITRLLPDKSLFLYMYVRKEAVLSSQIEGTQSSLSDFLLHESGEAPGIPIADVQEVSNYIAAMTHGIQRISDGFPLSLRLLREIHGILLKTGRGAHREPGAFRRSQNWIGGEGDRPGTAIYVPPPPEEVMPSMSALEAFIHNKPRKTPILIKAALCHAQFETIHPFLDGNGRLGRLLITLLLCSEGVIKEPMLYLSIYLKSHRQQYYDLLQRVRHNGDWEKWLVFFLTGVRETADLAIKTAKTLDDLFAEDRGKIEALGRATGTALRVHHAFKEWPILTIPKVARLTNVSFATAQKAIAHLKKLGIVKEIPKSKKPQAFSYAKFINIINEGTEPL